MNISGSAVDSGNHPEQKERRGRGAERHHHTGAGGGATGIGAPGSSFPTAFAAGSGPGGSLGDPLAGGGPLDGPFGNPLAGRSPLSEPLGTIGSAPAGQPVSDQRFSVFTGSTGGLDC